MKKRKNNRKTIAKLTQERIKIIEQEYMKDIMQAYHNGNTKLTKTLILGKLKTNQSQYKVRQLLTLYNEL